MNNPDNDAPALREWGEGCACAPFDDWDICYFVPDDVSSARAALDDNTKGAAE